MTKKIIVALTLTAATLMSGSVFAQAKDGPWMVRARVVNLQSANTNSPAIGLTINDKTIPEVDFSYFFTPNVAVELILTVPQEHDVSLNGAKIGTLSHLPPTLLAQYHFNASGFKPYVGAGINYTKFTAVDLPAGYEIKRDSVGGALQVGVDIPLSGNMYLNFDVKKVFLETDLSSSGAKVTTFKVDPLLVGLGIGWRF